MNKHTLTNFKLLTLVMNYNRPRFNSQSHIENYRFRHIKNCIFTHILLHHSHRLVRDLRP